jgi:ABC-2 type transport system ATP-binding protein
MIHIKNLVKKFGSITAVHIDELSIDPGEIIGIAGNNGAGKTTLLRLMLDLLRPEKGWISSKGKPVYQSEHWKEYTGSYIDQNFLIEFLRPGEYFGFIGKLYGIRDDMLKSRLEKFTGFMNHEILGQKKLIRELSSGNKHKVGIIGALISEPEIIILDEPFNFLDPGSQILLKVILRDLNLSMNSTLIISSHNLPHIADLCTRIVLMEKGEIIKDIKNTGEDVRTIHDYFLEYSNIR